MVQTQYVPSYDMLTDSPRDFLAVTTLTLGELHRLLPAFQEAYAPKRVVHSYTYMRSEAYCVWKSAVQRADDTVCSQTRPFVGEWATMHAKGQRRSFRSTDLSRRRWPSIG